MRPLAIIPALAVLGTGCAVTGLDGTRMGVGSESFADYVESVFRRQNQVATDLAFALDSEDPESDRYRQLESADFALQTACRGLNELANAARDGDTSRGPGSLKRARKAPECEKATVAADALLLT